MLSRRTAHGIEMTVATTTKLRGVADARERYDVLIVGAGISGVGAAYHLTTQCPGTSFLVLEAQESFGGTWLTHRYPRPAFF
jgi:cation diffusion facilitator CzcD-associated flavoprotein CzcO